jgi:hypothetical protein
MTARSSELVANHAYGEGGINREPVQPIGELEPGLTRVVDPRPDSYQLADGPEVINHGSRDPETGGYGFHRGWHRTSRGQGRQQSIHPFLHDRIEGWPTFRQSDPVAGSQQLATDDHAVHHGAQLTICQGERLATMANRAAGLTRAQLGDEGIHPNVRAQGRPSQLTAQRRHQAALGEPSLAGINRSFASDHGDVSRRWGLGASPRPRS